MEEKNEIRNRIKAINRSLSTDFKASASEIIFKKLERLDIFKKSSKILVYYSLNDEVSTIEFISRWTKIKHIFLPKVEGSNLKIIEFKDSSILNKGSFNIMEPCGTSVPLSEMDVVIVPAVAISPKGKRIGRGKGFYDRLLSQSSVPKICVVYEHQICQDFFDEPHDVKMNVIITQNRIINL